MPALYIFDCSKISAGEYGDYVFKIMTQSLARPTGTCRFNHGDGSKLNAKEIAAHAMANNGRLLQAKAITVVTPLTDANAEFTGSIYFVGMWTDEQNNLDTVHATFDQPRVEGVRRNDRSYGLSIHTRELELSNATTTPLAPQDGIPQRISVWMKRTREGRTRA